MSNTLFESQHYTMRLTPKETEPLSLSLSLTDCDHIKHLALKTREVQHFLQFSLITLGTIV